MAPSAPLPDSPACPVCRVSIGSSKEPKPLRRSYRGHGAELRMCSRCSHIAFQPMLSEELIERFYVGSRTYSGDDTTDYEVERFAETADYILDEVLGEVLDRGSSIDLSGIQVLDYGCGTGGNVDALRERGVEAHGVDLNPEAVAHAHELGNFHVHTFDEGHALLEAEGQFDVILLYHVIEHLRDPAATLDGLRPLLKPSGSVVVYCPNGFYTPALVLGNDRYEWVHFPLHLHYFTAWSLRRLAQSLELTASRLETTEFEPRPDLWHVTSDRAPKLAAQRDLGGRELRGILSAAPTAVAAELVPDEPPMWRWNSFADMRLGSILPDLVAQRGRAQGWELRFGADGGSGTFCDGGAHSLRDTDNSWLSESGFCVSPSGLQLRGSIAAGEELTLRMAKPNPESPAIEITVDSASTELVRQELFAGDQTISLGGVHPQVTLSVRSASSFASSRVIASLDITRH